MTTARDYAAIAKRLTGRGDRSARMHDFVNACWEVLSPSGVSWIGFYVRATNDELVLVCCRNKPACSPIGMHGACGRCVRSKRPLVVRDVRALGENYIACDPRDQSELVIPLPDEDGSCWGVLDVDSYDVGAFGDEDVHGFIHAMRVGGLLPPSFMPAAIETL